jgi:hypothetical protein
VTLVEHGGKFRTTRLGIRFTTLVLPDNTRQTIQTDALFRDGDHQRARPRRRSGEPRWARSSARRSAARRARRSTMAGAGRRQRVASGRNDAVFAAGTPLTLRLTSPITVLVEEIRIVK